MTSRGGNRTSHSPGTPARIDPQQKAPNQARAAIRDSRTTHGVSDPSRNSEIELTIDKGTIAAGRQSSPICEVELELKRGDAAELFKVARELAQQVPVRLTVTSKPERGYALIAGKKARAVGATPVAISPDASCQAAFQISARACLHQIVANQNPTRSGDAEGVHQARVGLRRLRAAISLFGGMLLDPRSSTIKRELKWITGELAPARDLDVFIKGVVTPATAGKSQYPGMATLTRDLRRKRREAFGRARSAISPTASGPSCSI